MNDPLYTTLVIYSFFGLRPLPRYARPLGHICVAILLAVSGLPRQTSAAEPQHNIPLVRADKAMAFMTQEREECLTCCGVREEHAGLKTQPDSYWWHRYPTFGALSDQEEIRSAGVRLVLLNISADPAWGPYAQHANSHPLFSKETTGFPTPTYPDGRPAVGWLPDQPYPVNALIYDACCAKDINGLDRPKS